MISIENQERPWGRYFVLHDEPTYKLKRIEVDPGGRLSYQYHLKRSEAWTIVEGIGRITLDGEIKVATYSVMLFITQRLLWPLTELGIIFDAYQKAMASFRRIVNLKNTKATIENGSNK